MKAHPADTAVHSERLAIGCALYATGPAPLLAEGLRASHFSSTERMQIWNALCEDAALRSDGRPDSATIQYLLETAPTDEMRAMAMEISSAATPDPAHAIDYARAVIAGHARRACVEATVTLQEDFYAGRDPSIALEKLQKYAAITSGTVRAGVERTADWSRAFHQALLDGRTFAAQDVPPRPALLHTFFREGDCGFIFAPRGVGKTWLAMLMAGAVADGAALGAWTAGAAGPCPVCYVDGEVNLPDSVERARLLDLSANVHWLHHKTICAITGGGLNLADPVQQRALLEMLIARGIRVLFLDNLSCLMRGMAENEADDWEKVLDWILQLRRANISVVIVHHAGRNGQMRGTSRREDNVHWILRLEDAAECDSAGAVFTTTLVKNRNTRGGNAASPSLTWTLTTEDERLTTRCELHSDLDVFVSLVNGGLSSARDIAIELDVTPGAVSKWARRAAQKGLIRIENRQYLPAA